MSDDSTQKDGKIVDLRDTLRTLLQRYKDVSFMDSPEWETSQEIPVNEAERILDDEETAVVEREFNVLRKLSLKIEKYLEVKTDVENGAGQKESDLEDLEIRMREMIQQHRSLKEKQGIVRVN